MNELILINNISYLRKAVNEKNLNKKRTITIDMNNYLFN